MFLKTVGCPLSKLKRRKFSLSLYELYEHVSVLNLLLLVFSLWAGLAGTRAQSGDRYGSGTLHSRQVLRGSLPLLSPY
jgi:hypothetical protein